jgi:phage replication-related protein YjqB (UPF0714/DUF867 family)
LDLAELLQLPGVEEECVLRSAVGFMALHGGSQDRGTDDIASRAAEESGASLYAIVQPGGTRVHLTSRRHDPSHSELLQAFLRHVRIAISVHGFGRDSFSVIAHPLQGVVIEPYGPAHRGQQTGPLRGIILGGLNAQLVEEARRLLHQRFDGFYVSDRLQLGNHPDNPVNLPASHGVQIELPPGLRGIGDLGEHLVPSRDGAASEVVTALVELAERAQGLLRTG